jgi:hypothetical protein
LLVNLGMIGQTKVKLHTHQLMQSFPELRSELGTSIRHNFLRHTVKTNNSGYVQLYRLRFGIRHLDWYEMSNLG